MPKGTQSRDGNKYNRHPHTCTCTRYTSQCPCGAAEYVWGRDACCICYHPYHPCLSTFWYCHPYTSFCNFRNCFLYLHIIWLLVLCPDPTPKRGRGSGAIRAVRWFCCLNSYMTFGGYYTLISNFSHLHSTLILVVSVIKSHVWTQTCNLIDSPDW